MTVQDFIPNYNATFKYIHEHYGKAAVVAFWEYLGDTGCELKKMVKEQGLLGYLRFFYGDQGTCTREDVEGGAYIDKDGLYVEKVDACPSVGELRERSLIPYRYYCEHCYWLYHKALEENGFTYDAHYSLQPQDGTYPDTCLFTSHKACDHK